MLVLGSLKERSKELLLRARRFVAAKLGGNRQQAARVESLRKSLPLLAGLAAVIQHDFFAIPANPAGEGTWANIFLVQKDFSIFQH